jgi:hypothetical protein
LTVIPFLTLNSGGCVVDRGGAVCSGGIIGDTLTSNAITSVSSVSSLLGSDSARWTNHAWLTDIETKASNVDVAVAPDEKSAEDGLGKDIEDTVEDSFRVRGDNVPTLGQAPSDGVQEPETDCPDAANGVSPIDVGTEHASVAATFEDNGPGDKEEGNAAEDEIAPFVGALDQGPDQASDNHDLID